jgi:exocyst complex component 8
VSNFQACFPPLMMSACVKWAKEQVNAFNTILERQLSSAEHGGPVWTACMNQAKDHAKMLSEVGLDFKNLVGHNLDSTQSQESSVGLGLSS